MSSVIVVFLLLLIAKAGVQVWLDLLNRKSVLSSASRVPEHLREIVDEDTYNRSVAYTLAKSRLSVRETIFDAMILGVILLPWIGGESLLSLYWGWLGTIFGSGFWAQGLMLFVVAVTLSIPGLPWEWYAQFRLEERFGFNKSTLKLWILDRIKGLIIGFVLLYPLLVLLLWLVGLSEYWWIWAFVVFFLFQIAMILVVPMFVMPLFNKFEELPEGELRDAVFELGDRTGFRARTILVMDGSRRSAHSNALFTGIGKFRRIVLFDTLMDQLSRRELLAVLAHEIGHYKMGHIPKRIFMSAVSILIGFAVIGWLAQAHWFTESFGFEYIQGNLAPTFLLFGMLSGLLTFWLTPLDNLFSRKHEFEADHFAREAMESDPQPLIGALRGLSQKNLSNLTPHPIYSAFYYSHPTLLEREEALRSV